MEVVAVVLLLLGLWLAPLGVAVALVLWQRRALRALSWRLEALEGRLEQGTARERAPAPVAQAPPAHVEEPADVPDEEPADRPHEEPPADAPHEEQPPEPGPLPDEGPLPEQGPLPGERPLPELEDAPLDAPWPDERPPPPPPAWRPPSPERVVVWVAAALGGLAVVLTGLLALVAVADRGWLLPSLRVSGALLAGMGLWSVGTVLRERAHPWVGSALAGAGAGTLYGGLWAGAGLYHLLPSSIGGALMVAVTVVATLQAVRRSDRFLAWLGLLGGLLTPILVSSGENRPVQLFAYLTLLAAGMVAAGARRRWPDLIVGAALGAGALHLGWSARWHAPDQAAYALLGAWMLSLPLAGAAALRDRAVHTAGAVGAVGLCLLAIPWVGPIDPMFYDPRSGEMVMRLVPGAPWLSAAAVTLLPMAPWLAGRVRGHELGGVAGSLVALPLVFAWGSSWAEAEPAAGAVALAAVGPLAAGALLTVGHRASSQGLLPVPIVAGAALSTGTLAGTLVGAPYALGVLGLAGLGLAVARSAGWGWILPAVAAGGLLPLWAAADDPEALGLRWVLAPSLAIAALLTQLPVLQRWERGRPAALATAAVTGPLLLPPLYAVWDAGWNLTVIGLLPLLVAANALLATGVLVRTRRVGRDDWVLGLFVAVVLFGLSAALPLQLQERWLTVAWAVEVAALAAVSRRVTHPLVRWFAVGLSVVVGVRLLFNPYALAWGDAAGWPVLNWTLYAWGVPLVCLLVAARVWPELRRAPSDALLRHAPALFGTLAVLVGFALVNVQVAHAFQDAGPIELGGHGRFEGMVRSVSWAGYGLAVLSIGTVRDLRAVRFAGFAFVLLAAFKVFAVDLWGLTGFARVGSVGGLAVTLLLAAFLFERLVRGGAGRPVEDR